MNIAEIEKATAKLLLKTVAIREKIENSTEHMPYKSGLVKTLMDIEVLLSTSPLDLKNWRRMSLGFIEL